MKKTALLLSLLFLVAGFAPVPQDEPVSDPESLIAQGFKPAPTPEGARVLGEVPVAPPNSLPWPVKFQDASHSMGNSMAEYQFYGGAPYWHAGCDLRVKAGAEVRTPVAGRLEAGHYSYAVKKDGSMEKYWRPWPESGKPNYFEISVIADDGTRYEFHHIDRTSLPKFIVDLLDGGGEPRVAAGELLGETIAWSDGVYHHIHYNVIAPDGTRINPEYVSPLIADTQAPEIQSVHALMPDGQVVAFGDGRFDASPVEFVVAVTDKKDGNVYVQPPAVSRLVFASGARFEWDFSSKLARADGTFPGLFETYAKSLVTPTGRTLETTGTYGAGVSLVRLTVPSGARGAFTLQFLDSAGNMAEKTGSIR